MTVLEVTQCGPGASVQDLGRIGYRRYGVSTAGAMDRQTLALANALVGNPQGAAALELPLSGAAFRVIGGSVLIAACGPGTTLTVSGRAIPERTSAQAFDGDDVRVGPPRLGVYGYLAVAGGIQTAPVLGSRSRHRRSGIGGEVLSSGDRLPCADTATGRPMFLAERPDFDADRSIGILPGPQAGHFPEETWSRLLSATYRIDPRSDRMGLRLEGPELRSDRGYDILSEGVVPGSIQVPGDGAPIVLGRDCQTTGGYPKIAMVITADQDRLAQIPIGRDVRFRRVSRTEAMDALRRSVLWRDGLRTSVRPAGAAADLLSQNLIGGVTTGDEL